MKDVLKSLSVTGTGTELAAGAVSFDTLTDPHTQLGGRGVQIESGNALRGLFDGLRAAPSKSTTGDTRHRGEVIGVDESAKYRQVLVLRTDAGSVSLIELADVGAVTLAEGPSRENLEYLLDGALTAGQHCQLGVQVRGSGTVQVSWCPPLWRLSYRLVRDGDTLVLTAMGIVHNPVDEDLTDIALTLTTVNRCPSTSTCTRASTRTGRSSRKAAAARLPWSPQGRRDLRPRCRWRCPRLPERVTSTRMPMPSMMSNRGPR